MASTSMKRIYGLFLLILLLTSARAQQGSIRGKITDSKTGEDLIGATAMLEGITIGASTDLEGNYAIENVEPGTYSIKCQYISYETMIITGVAVKPGQVYVLNVRLVPVSYGLQEVVVEAKTLRHTEAALLTMQQKSATVIDGISAQQISRSGDGDAAQALKRITGVTVEGGKYVYVRGLSDRYSKTLLNGAEIPGLDPNRNTVQLDLFPGNLIESILVHKAFSPELSGSFTGGMVDVRTRDFPEKYTLRFSTSFSYNTQSSLRKRYLTYKDGNLDWLGIDDGTRDLPVNPEDIPYYPTNRDRIDEVTRSFNKIMAPEEKRSFLDHSHSFSVGNRVNLFGKPLGFIAGLSYSRSYHYYDGGRVGYYRLLGSGDEVLNEEYIYDDRQGEMDVLWGGLLNLSYKFSNKHKVALNVIHNHGGQSSARYMIGEVPSDGVGRFRETRTLKFIERSLTFVQLRSEHYFEELAGLKVEFQSAYSYSVQNEPDLRFFTNSYYPDAPEGSRYALNPSEYRVPARYFRDLNQHNLDNGIHGELPFDLLGAASKFRFGGSLLYVSRDFNEKRLDYQSQVSYYSGDVEEYLSDEYIGQNHPLYDPVTKKNYGLYIQDATDLKNSYTSDQTVAGTYLMTDVSLFTGLRLIAGARLETNHLFSESDNPKYEPGKLNDNDLLPSVNLTYTVFTRTNLRLAYNRTLARPSFREIAPGDAEEFQGGLVYVGNPDLKRTLIDNFDLRWEYYPDKGEVWSAGMFYKTFKDPIELADDIRANNTQLTWINTKEATVYGAELEIRKKLGFIPLTGRFSLGANLALVRSLVSIDSLELLLIRAYDPGAEDTRVMFGQAPYALNALMSYDNDSVGLSANLSFNITGKKLAVVMRGGTPNVFEEPSGLLNFTLEKKVGRRMALTFAADNILDRKIKYTYNYRGKEYIYRSYTQGIRFSTGFTWYIQ
jgi:outer membrane receptor protein involved in Fe transport